MKPILIIFSKFRNLRICNLLLFVFCLVIFLPGCKDTTAVHQSGVLETCKGLIDDENWDEAVSTCEDVDNDEGWHLAAQAYMGRAGLSLFDVVNTMMSSSDDDGAATVIFAYLPETTSDTNDYKSALESLMGNDSSGKPYIGDKSQTVYLEAVLVSSMLIFKELKTLLGLGLANGAFTTCSLDATADNTCTFIPTIQTQVVSTVEVPEKLVFGGLGSSFYTAICGQANDASFDGTKQTDVTTDEEDPADPPNKITVTVTNNVTVNGCTIQEGSPLYYNRIANQGFTGVSEISGLEALDFYTMMDHGRNFAFEVVEAYGSTPAVELSFCNQGYIDLPDATDDKLNDCEILAMFTDESSDIF